MTERKAARNTAYFGVMLGLALICGFIETLIPFDFGIPGIKLGLANAVALYVFYKNGFVPSLIVNVARICLVGILFGNALSLVYSLSGGVLAVLTMWCVWKFKCFSVIGVSVAGAVMHGVGQLLCAAVVISFKVSLAYLPFLMISGAVTGTLIGIAVTLLLKRAEQLKL